jgi:hypothetical protein
MEEERPNLALIVLRGVVLINGLFFLLSFFPWWEGTVRGPGVVDQLLNHYRWGGFRADVVWFAATTVVLFVAFCFFLFECMLEGREAWRSRFVDIFLCLASVSSFVGYLLKEPWF